MYNTYLVDTELFIKENIRFDSLKVMEDFYVTLSFLTRGYPNAVVFDYCWNQLGSGAEGGCAEYRDEEMQAQAAKELHATFPGFVRVVEKTSKTAWEGMETRTDVNVLWKKAFESSQKDMKEEDLI
jgi:hypothetical protein